MCFLTFGPDFLCITVVCVNEYIEKEQHDNNYFYSYRNTHNKDEKTAAVIYHYY